MDDTQPSATSQVASQAPLNSDGINQGMRVLSSLIAGVLVYGALGWLGDHYLGTAFLLPVGIVAGAAGGCYVTVKRLLAPIAAPAEQASSPQVSASAGTGPLR